jgi:hypothetical protein
MLVKNVSTAASVRADGLPLPPSSREISGTETPDLSASRVLVLRPHPVGGDAFSHLSASFLICACVMDESYHSAPPPQQILARYKPLKNKALRFPVRIMQKKLATREAFCIFHTSADALPT